MNELRSRNSSAPLRGARRLVALLALALCVVAALALVADTGFAIWMFGFSELHADQFTQYRTLLDNEFLMGLVLPANGHRHVISNIVRWLDIVVYRGDQTAGVVAGLLIWLSAWGIASWQCWRATVAAPLQRAAALLLCATAFAWLGSARVLLHGNEAPQVYFVVCCALLSLACIADRERCTPQRWVLAVLFGVLGMLSFGSGVAIFGGLLAFAVILRHPWRHVVLASVAAAAAVVLYSVLLPGGDSVRSTLTLKPLVVLGNAAAWLGSAITTGWLSWGAEGGFGAPPSVLERTGQSGHWLGVSAVAVRQLFGDASAAQVARVCGSIGLVALGGFALHAWWRPQRLTPLGRIGLGIALFIAALATLVSIGRSDYFVEFPDQLLADRYVMWTVLFWLGIALCALGAFVRSGFAVGWAGLALAALIAVAAWPTHNIGFGWGMSAARAMEARAAQAQAGVLLPGWTGHSNLIYMELVEESLQFYRDQQQAMFRTPRSRLLGERLPAERLAAADAAAELDWYPHEAGVVVPENTLDGSAWHVAGHLFAERQPDEGIIAVDAQRRVVGFGEFSYDHPGSRWQRLDDVARGFDLYLRSPPTDCPRVVLYRSDAAAERLERMAPLACARNRAGDGTASAE